MFAASENIYIFLIAIYSSNLNYCNDSKYTTIGRRPYYEMKAQFNQMLEEQKTRVSLLERSVGEAKMTYAEALRNLEKISDEIHRVSSNSKNSLFSNA